MDQEAERALTKTKIHLMGSPDSVFFSSLCCQLLHQWDDTQPTAATDGLSVYYNRDFFMDLQPIHRLGLLVHEIMHVALGHTLELHPDRAGTLNFGRANRAMDYSINLIITKAGFKLPPNALLDDAYDGLTWRQIYDLLEDEPNDNKPGDVRPDASQRIEDISNHIDNMLVQAATQAQMADQAGTIPGELARKINKLTKPEIKWQQILASFFTEMAKIDYSFLRPNRRFFTQGILMPSCSGYQLEKGAVAIDTSGSISPEEFQAFITETHQILKEQMPKELHFLQFDTRIAGSDRIESIQELGKIKLKGGGGTNILPVMKWAEKEKPNWLIVFTDGHFRTPDINPKVPVIWVIHSNPTWKGPFGRTVHFKFKDEN